MPIHGPDIIAQYNRKKQGEWAAHAPRWEQMAPYLAPSRVGILTQATPGATKQTTGVYDSTTLLAAETLAMFIAGHTINPAQRWFDYRLRDERIGALDEVQEWMQECRDLTLTRVASSPFYGEAPEALVDYGGFGTGFLLCEEAPQPVNRVVSGFRGFYFHAEKTGRFLIDEGPDGLVDTAFREFTLTARRAHDQWPPGHDRHTGHGVSEAIQRAVREGQPDRTFQFLHAIYPRPKADRSAGARGMPWMSVWLEIAAKHIVHESGYQSFPAAVPRYHKTPGEVYGRGRGDIAFPDTWTLNTAKRMGFEDWALKIRPPIFTRSDSVIGSLRITPAGWNSINTHGMPIRDVAMPWETGSRPEVSQIKEDELRRSIREIFYVDAIRQLLQVEKSEMTAFEFAKKLELLFRLLGPVYGRMEWEFLHRVVDTTFALQLEAGALPPPPPAVFESDGQIDIAFQNPILRAQRAGDAEALVLAISDLAPLAQQFPQMLDRLDTDAMVSGLLTLRGVPAKWQRNDTQMQQLRAERAKVDQQENALAQAEQAASAAGKAAPMLKMMQGGMAGQAA